jgi:hypothetical protein
MDSIVSFENTNILYHSGIISSQDIYQKIVNGSLSVEDYKNIVGEDCPELPLETLKQNKKNELWSACNSDIQNGFIYNYRGTDYLLGYDLQTDQPNLDVQYNLLNKVVGTITWKVKGQLIFLDLTTDEFADMYLQGALQRQSKSQKYFTLCGQIESCTTKEEISNIVW